LAETLTRPQRAVALDVGDLAAGQGHGHWQVPADIRTFRFFVGSLVAGRWAAGEIDPLRLRDHAFAPVMVLHPNETFARK